MSAVVLAASAIAGGTASSSASALHAVLLPASSSSSSAVSSWASGLTNNPHVVGAAWLVSSALFTTYSTTKFLKYHNIEENDNGDDPTSATVSNSLLTKNTIENECAGGGNVSKRRRGPFLHQPS